MKVHFEATMDDFVDVSVRSNPPTWEYYLTFGVSTLSTAIILGLLLHFVYGNPILTGIVAIGSIVYAVIVNHGARGRRARNFITEMYRPKWPIKVEVEINERGLSFKQFGITSTYDWRVVSSIGEIGDAVYFRTIFNQASAVRSRAFSSNEEKDEFIETSMKYMAATRSLTANTE